MSHILRTSTENITAPLADDGNYVYCQSSGAQNIKHIYNLWKSTLMLEPGIELVTVQLPLL